MLANSPSLELTPETVDAIKDCAEGDITKFGGSMFFEGLSAAKLDNPPGPSVSNDYSERLYKAGLELGRAALSSS